MVRFLKVNDISEIESVTALAHEIWNEHFVPIIGQAQVDYMLGKFQSIPAIGEQIANGYQYYIVSEGGQGAGYVAVVASPETSSAQLSKIYIKEEQRGRGLGKAAMEFVEDLCLKMGIRKLWLTVNKHNTGSIAFYERVGWTNAGPTVQDIGGGFVMDDYKMEKLIA